MQYNKVIDNPVIIDTLKEHPMNKEPYIQPKPYKEPSESFRSELKYYREFNSMEWGC